MIQKILESLELTKKNTEGSRLAARSIDTKLIGEIRKGASFTDDILVGNKTVSARIILFCYSTIQLDSRMLSPCDYFESVRYFLETAPKIGGYELKIKRRFGIHRQSDVLFLRKNDPITLEAKQISNMVLYELQAHSKMQSLLITPDVVSPNPQSALKALNCEIKRPYVAGKPQRVITYSCVKK